MEFPLWYRSITNYTWLAGHSKLTMVLQPRTGRRAVPATQALQSWLQGLSRPQASQHFNQLFSSSPSPPFPTQKVRGVGFAGPDSLCRRSRMIFSSFVFCYEFDPWQHIFGVGKVQCRVFVSRIRCFESGSGIRDPTSVIQKGKKSESVIQDKHPDPQH